MNVMALILMLLYLAGGAAYGYLYGFTPRLNSQLAICGGGAVGLLVFYFIPVYLNRPKKESKPMLKPKVSQNSTPLKDFESLQYLRQRALELESEEMFKLLSEINTILFSMKENTEGGDRANE